MSKLLTPEDCENLSINEVWDYYRQFVNAGQVDLIASFGFGRELVEKAEGCWIYTKSGRKILDFTGGIGVLNHGHNHPRILAARKRYQEKKRMEVHKNFFSPYVAGLSHNLAQILPGDLNICYFPNSGAESVEGSMKIAYKYHGGNRKFILYSDISFHGKLHGAASVTASPELHFKFPQIPNTARFEYNSIASVKKQVSELKKADGTSDIYAIIVEPMNASSLRQCSKEFLHELRDICTREDIVLIFDEVYTGWAKAGQLFYFMHHQVIPDVLAMAKSFGGGKASISGYVTRPHIFKKAYGNLSDATLHSTTYNGFGEETATAIEAVNIIVEDDYVSKSKHIYEKIHPRLLELQKKYPKMIQDVRGSGALNGILLNPTPNMLTDVIKMIPSDFFKDDRFLNKFVTAAVINDLYQNHGIVTFYGSNREILLIISPPLIILDEEIDYFLKSLDETLSKGFLSLCLSFLKNKFFSRT